MILFGGIGLFALPLDLINEFRQRPKARKKDEMAKTRDQLVVVLKELVEEADEI